MYLKGTDHTGRVGPGDRRPDQRLMCPDMSYRPNFYFIVRGRERCAMVSGDLGGVGLEPKDPGQVHSLLRIQFPWGEFNWMRVLFNVRP